jgi:hypothetical protein
MPVIELMENNEMMMMMMMMMARDTWGKCKSFFRLLLMF